MTILLVDDDQIIVRFLTKALTKSGYMVVSASNAAEALAMLAQITVNLIISDVAMPDMDGVEFCKIVRQRPESDYIPIIFLSALKSVDDLATGLVAGADDYLTKPVRLKELLETIEEYAM